MHVSFGNTRVHITYVILGIVAFWVLAGSALCACCAVTPGKFVQHVSNLVAQRGGMGIEGFAAADGPTTIQPVEQWSAPPTVHSTGKPVGDNFFEGTDFKPGCCANSSYSSSTGCACLSVEQYDFLKERGGNNVPPTF